MLSQRRRGQGLAEYSIIVALVAIGAIVALTLLGTTSSEVFSDVVCHVQGADPAVFPNSPCVGLTPSASGLPDTGGGYPGVVKADAPSAYWRLNEAGVGNGSIAVDEIPTPPGSDPGTYNLNGGSITSGIIPGALSVGATQTIKGSAVAFGGGADMSAATLTALQGTSPRTVEVWFKTSDNKQAQNIFEAGGSGAGNSMLITLNPACCQEGTSAFANSYSSPGTLEVSFDTAGAANFVNGASGYEAVFPKMNLADGHWHYLVVTLSGPTLNVYVDSVQPMGDIEGTGGNNGTGVDQAQPLTLGFTPNTATSTLDWGGNTLAGATFDGQMQEAAVYNFALSGSQVSAHYVAGVGALTTDTPTAYSAATLGGDSANGCPPSRVVANTCAPQAYWRMGDAGPVAVDSTGNDNGNYNGSLASTSPAYPTGSYSQSTNTGTGAANSSAFDAGSNATFSADGGQMNATGAGVRANTLSAFQGENSRSVKLWVQTSSSAPDQALLGTFDKSGFNDFNKGVDGNHDFNIDLLSPAGAGSSGVMAGVGGAPSGTTSNGGILVSVASWQAWVPASANLADGNWHYLVVTAQAYQTKSSQIQVYIDDTLMGGYACCAVQVDPWGAPGDPSQSTWSNLQSGGTITPGNDAYFNYHQVGGDFLIGPTADVTLGYETTQGGIGNWFKGQMQDVAVFNYVLTGQQVAYEWGQAHPGATCTNLALTNLTGNANGGTYPNFADGPVSATATQTCDGGADPYVTFYYALERYGVPPAAGTACYTGNDLDVQVPWITSGEPWVYCYPGGYPNPAVGAPTTPSSYTVAERVGSSPVVVTFYQGEILTPCTVVWNGHAEPLYFIEAQNGYPGGNSPATPGSGIALNATQSASGGLDHNLATSQNGTAVTPAWGVTGPTAANCLPAPANGTSSSGAITSNSAIGGEYAGSDYAPWVQQQGPFILLTPSTASVGLSQNQTYTATAYTALGVLVGDVTGSTTLTVMAGATCDNGAHTCQSGTPGDYTVTGTYGSEQSQATLTVTNPTYANAVTADSPSAWWRLSDPCTANGNASEVDNSAAADSSGHGNTSGFRDNNNNALDCATAGGPLTSSFNLPNQYLDTTTNYNCCTRLSTAYGGNNFGGAYANASVNPFNGDHARTVEIWYKYTGGGNGAPNGNGDLFEGGNFENGGTGAFQVIMDWSNGSVDGGVGGLLVEFDRIENGANAAEVFIPSGGLGNPAFATDGNWHMLDVTLSGNNVVVYIDGAPTSGFVNTAGAYIWNGNVSCGGSVCTLPATPNTTYDTNNGMQAGGERMQNEGWDRTFQGAIDEVSIYGTALNSTQVAAHYTAR